MSLFRRFGRSPRRKASQSKRRGSNNRLLLERLEPRQLLAADVAISLKLTDTSGVPISHITVGQDFQLRAFVQDVRVGASQPGVGAAYTDVTFNGALASSGPIIHSGSADFDYGNTPTGTVSSGLLDEAGGFQTASGPLGSGQRLLFIAPMHANAAGSTVFQADPADNLPLDDTLFFNPVTTVPVENISYGSASLTIDSLPQLVVANQSVTEGTGGTSQITFSVSLATSSPTPVTVNYATASNSAIEGTDFTQKSGTLTFPSNSTTAQTITIAVNPDNIFETDESFFLNFSNPVGATLPVGPVTGTILNDDPQPTISINSFPINETESDQIAQFTVTLSNPSYQTITVGYTPVAGTADATDFGAASGTLTFGPGVTSQNIPVTILGDAKHENSESFSIQLHDAVNAVATTASGTATIIDNDALPVISISSPTAITEPGVSTTLSFTVSIVGSTQVPASVHWATAPDTATAGADYQTLSGDLTFSPTDTSKTISITILGDTLRENPETFFVNLSAASGATLGTSQATGTIQDDGDPEPIVLIVSPAAIVEGDSGTKQLTFSVALSTASGQNVTVNYATADVSAIAGKDYVATSGTLTFQPGEQVKTFVVNISGDTIDEDDETFTATLSGGTNVILGSTVATGTITDNDLPPSISIANAQVAEGDSGKTPLTFTLTLSSASGKAVSVAYSTADGTALANSDYDPLTGVVTFQPGITTQTIQVLVDGDADVESDETFVVNLSNPVNGSIAASQATGTILNDEMPTIFADDASVTEGETGAQQFSYNFTLSKPATQIITFNVSTSDGTAVDGTDYKGGNVQVTFQAGESSHQIGIPIAGNTLHENNRTFFLHFSSPQNAILSRNQAVVTIVDNDPLPTISVDPVTVNEGNSGVTTLAFKLSLSAPSGLPVTVSYGTVNGTAIAGTDYVATAGTAVFGPGETEKTIPVNAIPDTKNGVDRQFSLEFTANGATFPGGASTGAAIGTILDDDAVPSISIADASVSEGNTGTTPLILTLTLSAASSQTISVAYSTADGTATAGSDYQAVTNTATFQPGQTTQTIQVLVKGDTDQEGDETLKVNLSNPLHATLAVPQATGTILTDELPRIIADDVTVTEGESGAQRLTYTFALSQPTTETVTFNIATADGTAIDGVDYRGGNTPITFAPGETTHQIGLPIAGNQLHENNRTFYIFMSGPQNAILSRERATVTIIDNDPVPSLVAQAVATNEGDAGLTPFAFKLSLLSASGLPVTVSYGTVDGTAVAGKDYVAVAGTVVFAPGEVDKTIPVSVFGNTINEADKQFRMEFTADGATFAGGSLKTGLAPATIVNDDATGSFSGTVYLDSNNDGVKATSETGLGGVKVTLSGHDIVGNSVERLQVTGSDGSYSFQNVPRGNYTVKEWQPGMATDGKEAAGGMTTIAGNDLFLFNEKATFDSTNNNFGERSIAISALNRNVFSASARTAATNTFVPNANQAVYVIDARSAGQIIAHVTSTASGGNYQLSLYNKSMQLVASSGAATAKPSLSYFAQSAGSYLLLITGPKSKINLDLTSP